MPLVAAHRLFVVLFRSPDRCDLDDPIGFEEIAVDQTVRSIPDLQLGPRAEEVLAGGIGDRRL